MGPHLPACLLGHLLASPHELLTLTLMGAMFFVCISLEQFFF